MKNNNSYSELEHLELVARRIAESGIDITSQYKDWITVTLACASVGESARKAYHTICSQYSGYERKQCDEKFDNCLHTGRGDVRLASLMQLAKDCGVDISLPRGARRKTASQKQQERENRIQQMREMLNAQGQWRFNVWRQRPEVLEPGKQWRPVQDRDLDTYYCRLKEQGLNVTNGDVKSLIFSRDFTPDYDVCREWLESLKPWNPDTDPDYLHDFYVGHMEFGDPENEVFYDQMLKKWHVGMVALMLGRIHENPQMPIFKGKQRIGKTFVARNILPPALSELLLEVGPAERIDKDFIISLSETPLILFDEISFGSSQKNEAFKYIVTSTSSNVRDSYARFREHRQRRASLVATTNDDTFIRATEGTRRYLAIDLKETVDLDAFPLPYEGAYAQALYLLDHGFEPKPTHEESQLISEHNKRFEEPDDCEEAILVFLKVPETMDNTESLSAGDIMRELNLRGFHGRQYNSNSIGKAMKKIGFESKTIHGINKYLVTKVNTDERNRNNKEEAKEFIPEIF